MAKNKHKQRAKTYTRPQPRPARPVGELDAQRARKQLATPLQFSPMELDVGDGIVWQFVPDMMPAQSIALRNASNALADSFAVDFEGDDAEHPTMLAFNALAAAIRACLIPGDANENKFPQPAYGVQALTWFAGNIMMGRDDKLPT